MDKDTIQLMYEIEDTRARLDDVLDAIEPNADIPTRAKKVVAGGVDVVKTVVSDAAARIAEAVPSADDLRDRAGRMHNLIEENPIGFAIGAVAVGFVLGLLLPKTSIESDRVNDVKQMAKDAGAQAVEAGKQIVRDAIFGRNA